MLDVKEPCSRSFSTTLVASHAPRSSLHVRNGSTLTEPHNRMLDEPPAAPISLHIQRFRNFSGRLWLFCVSSIDELCFMHVHFVKDWSIYL